MRGTLVPIRLWLFMGCLLFAPTPSFSQFIALPSQAVDTVGSVVVFAITINNAPNAVDALGFDVTFDAAVLQYMDMFVPGVLVQDWGNPAIANSGLFDVGNPSAGLIKVAGVTPIPELVISAGSSGAIVLLDFMVLAPGEANLAVANPVDDVDTFTFAAESSKTLRLFGISTRSPVQTGEQVQIGGFIIDGSSPKTVLIRALGPSLVARGVAGALSDPVLQLFSGQTLLETNDNWMDHPRVAEIMAITRPVPPESPLDSSILVTLNPGPYTAIVSGVGGATGVALVEVFEVGGNEPANLFGISTRSQVQTGEQVQIGGFIIDGSSPKTVLIRALGPSLVARGVAGALSDPVLQLFSGQTLLETNDNWMDHPRAAEIMAITRPVPPESPLDSSILVTLNPGPYTAIVSGVGGAAGVALVEVFEVN